MSERSTGNFTYSAVEQLFQQAGYDRAIALLSARIEAQPEDRVARLMLLLANVLEFGAAGFQSQIEALRSLTDLSSDERTIVLRIYFAGYHDAERVGQMQRQSVYLGQIRQITLQQPIDLAAIEAGDFESVNDRSFATPSWRAWYPTSATLTAGATAMVVAAALGLYAIPRGPMPVAQHTEVSVIRANAPVQLETFGATAAPAVVLPSTYAIAPVREQITGQLDALNRAYAGWSQSGRAMSGELVLKLTVAPSGNVIAVDEVVSRLSDHQYLDAVIAEAKKWQLPLGHTATTEITIPLLFVPGQNLPLTLTAQDETNQPGRNKPSRPGPHTKHTLEQTELAKSSEKTPASKITLAAHTRGRLEVAGDTDFADSGAFRVTAAAKRELVAHDLEIDSARTVALKHEPRYAAAAVEKVGLGERVMVLRKERDWLKVKVNGSGNVGYMRKEFLTAFNSHR